MKKNIKLENYYRISQSDILAIDTLIEYLQYGVLGLLKAKPLQEPNEDSIGMDEYEAHLARVKNLEKKMTSSQTTRFYPDLENKKNHNQPNKI